MFQVKCGRYSHKIFNVGENSNHVFETDKETKRCVAIYKVKDVFPLPVQTENEFSGDALALRKIQFSVDLTFLSLAPDHKLNFSLKMLSFALTSRLENA